MLWVLSGLVLGVVALIGTSDIGAVENDPLMMGDHQDPELLGLDTTSGRELRKLAARVRKESMGHE